MNPRLTIGGLLHHPRPRSGDDRAPGEDGEVDLDSIVKVAASPSMTTAETPFILAPLARMPPQQDTSRRRPLSMKNDVALFRLVDRLHSEVMVTLGQASCHNLTVTARPTT